MNLAYANHAQSNILMIRWMNAEYLLGYRRSNDLASQNRFIYFRQFSIFLGSIDVTRHCLLWLSHSALMSAKIPTSKRIYFH